MLTINRRFLAVARLSDGHTFVLAADKEEFLSYMESFTRAAAELCRSCEPVDRLIRLRQAAFLASCKANLLK